MIRLNRKLLALTGMALAIFTCGTASMAQPVTPLEIVDQRPPTELKEKILSTWIFNCDYFTGRLDDRRITKPRIEQLRDDLSANLKGPLSGPVYVKHYNLYLNNGAQMTGQAWAVGMAGGAGVFLSPSGEKLAQPKCAKEKKQTAWFDASEVTNDKSPLIAEVEIEYLSKTYRARKVVSPVKRYVGRKNNVAERELQEGMFRDMNVSLANQINTSSK